MIKLLEEIDELLTFLEDTAHGEEGKRITEMRYKILTELSNSHKHGVSGKTNDDKIWQWVQWINKRCAFTEHQQDYIYFAIRQILKSEACASGAVDKTVRCGKCETLGHLAPCDECYLKGKIDSGG